jgi:hypothetical protein
VVFPSRVLPSSELLIIPRNRVKVVPLAGRNFMFQELGKSGDNRRARPSASTPSKSTTPTRWPRAHVILLTSADGLRPPASFSSPSLFRKRTAMSHKLDSLKAQRTAADHDHDAREEGERLRRRHQRARKRRQRIEPHISQRIADALGSRSPRSASGTVNRGSWIG